MKESRKTHSESMSLEMIGERRPEAVSRRNPSGSSCELCKEHDDPRRSCQSELRSASGELLMSICFGDQSMQDGKPC